MRGACRPEPRHERQTGCVVGVPGVGGVVSFALLMTSIMRTSQTVSMRD